MKAPVEFDVFTCGLDGINLIEASAGTGKTIVALLAMLDIVMGELDR